MPSPAALEKASLAAKAHGQGRGGPGPGKAYRLFAGGEAAVQKTLAKALQGQLDAGHLRQIQAYSHDHARSPALWAWAKGYSRRWGGSALGRVAALRARASISPTAASRPTNTARAMMEWPMEYSSMSGKGQQGMDVAQIQAMPGGHLEPQTGGQAGRVFQAAQKLLAGFIVRGVAIGPGVQLHHLGLALVGRLDLLAGGVDEQAHRDARLPEGAHRRAHLVHVARHVQAALGGQLLAFLGHQGADVRAHLSGDADHLLGGGHLHVEPALDHLAHHPQVAVLNVTAVFPKVHDDAVGPGLFGQHRRPHRVGLVYAPGLGAGWPHDRRLRLDGPLWPPLSKLNNGRENAAATAA